MRKFIILVLVSIIFLMTPVDALAGGDKVRGDKGQGTVVQHQVMLPPPFQP